MLLLAKAKRRTNKRKSAKRRAGYRGVCDRHHIFYQKRQYSNGLSALRNYDYCIVYIPKNTLHHQIHEAVDTIPKPRPANAREALWQLNNLAEYGAISTEDGIEKRLKVLISLFECVEPATTEALKMQLAIVQNYKSPH